MRIRVRTSRCNTQVQVRAREDEITHLLAPREGDTRVGVNYECEV